MEIDYIVIGQGLAGSSVAVQLLKRGKKIVVFDDPSANNSSRIAAGLFNPITGRKMSKTWLADKIFPYLHQYYREVEAISGEKFFHPIPLYRPFTSVEEQNDWMARSGDPVYAPFIQKILTGHFLDGVKDPYGGLLLRQCGFVNTEKYIRAVGILIERDGTLCREVFFPDDLKIHADSVSYRNINAAGAIFCTGVHHEKFFNWLPVRPLKGETISIKSQVITNTIVNRGVYMVPEEPTGHWRVGSTYHFHDRTPATTEEARKELEAKISELIESPFIVTDHQWGFRPTTPDRRPILGAHREFKNLVLFNGLGTKGASLAPYFSEVLVCWLEKEGPLMKEVDIERFK
jgi:glycine oxidase